MMATEGSNEACRRICVTPVRNEAWIINQFLAAAKTWADHVLWPTKARLTARCSNLENTPGVESVINDSPVYDEAHRQKSFSNARELFEADAFSLPWMRMRRLSANCLESKEWKQIADAEPGTILRFRWVNILPGFKEAWIPPSFRRLASLMTVLSFKATRIHSPRVPQPEGAPVHRSWRKLSCCTSSTWHGSE